MKLEMRSVKNIAAAAMTLAVVFGFASLKPVTASAAQAEAPVSASIEEENSYISYQDEIDQKDFLRLVNKERAKAGLNPFSWATTATTVLLRSVPKSWQSLTPTSVPMVSATSPSSQRTASMMCRSATTTWPAFLLPTLLWISG